MTNIIVFLFVLTGFGFTFAKNKLPEFSWVNDETPFAGIPLLRIHFSDGGSDDFAVLKPFNPIPLGPTERAEDVDPCIYHGYLLTENDVHITLTGCPYSDTFQLQFSSERLDQNTFMVTNGIVESLKNVQGFANDDVAANDENESQIFNRQMKPLSTNGYITNMKIYYEDNFYDKFGEDSVNTVRRILAHTQHIWKWSSLTTKVIFNVSDEVQHINKRWTAIRSLSEACTFNDDFSKTNNHLNIYLVARNVNSSGPAGMSPMNGACSNKYLLHCIIAEYIDDAVVAAITLAHEIGHTHGMPHDFNTGKPDPKFDSVGNLCTNTGGMMDYGSGNVGDNSRWTTCSVEAFTAFINKFPTCLKEIDPKNPPTEIAPFPLSPNECDLINKNPPNGRVLMYVNGIKCPVYCVDGICAPFYYQNTNKPAACISICGKSSCVDAVEPRRCDLTAIVQNFTGTTKLLNLNGFRNTFECINGLCYPVKKGFENACVVACGETDCSQAVDPGTCDLGKKVVAILNVCYNGIKSSVFCVSSGMCYPYGPSVGSYKNSCQKICGKPQCVKEDSC